MKISDKKPSFTKEELGELKEIHKKHTGELLSDQEVLEMAIRLLTLFKIIGQQIGY